MSVEIKEGVVGDNRYQSHLIAQILMDREFGEGVIGMIESSYFTVDHYKLAAIKIKNYYEKYSILPDIDSIGSILVERETNEDTISRLVKYGKDLYDYKQSIKDGLRSNDPHIKTTFYVFLKTQMMRKLESEMKHKRERNDVDNISDLFDKLQKIEELGSNKKLGIDVFDNIESVLDTDYRNPISTGIEKIDLSLGGGISEEEILIFLAPSGIGKTSILTCMANHAFNIGKNVLQIIFEDKEKEVQRKHFVKWAGVKLSEINDYNKPHIVEKVKNIQTQSNGILKIVKFSEEGTTVPIIKKWIEDYQKRYGFKFDLIIIDYLDCIESHKKGEDGLADELTIIKSAMAMGSDLKTRIATAIQSNRGGTKSKIVTFEHAGGNYKRMQKAHFVISISKTLDQKSTNRANLAILKSRSGKDGMVYEDIIFDNDSMIIQTTSDQSISANEFLTKHKNDLDPTDTLNFSVIEDIDAMLKSTNLN
jgi:KaiC/GvpD/RAD55 family RecA-like ATPase